MHNRVPFHFSIHNHMIYSCCNSLSFYFSKLQFYVPCIYSTKEKYVTKRESQICTYKIHQPATCHKYNGFMLRYAICNLFISIIKPLLLKFGTKHIFSLKSIILPVLMGEQCCLHYLLCSHYTFVHLKLMPQKRRWCIPFLTFFQ